MTTIDLAEYSEGTGIGNHEIYNIGVVLLNTIGGVIRLGHASPASQLDYLNPQSIPEHIVADFIAWTSNRTHMRPDGCEQRMRDLVLTTGWHDRQLRLMEDLFSGAKS